MFGADDAHDATAKFTETILRKAKQFISYRRARFQKSSHPWMNNKVMEAIEAKCKAYGSIEFPAAAARCRQVLADEYQSYRQKMREKLSGLPRGSKAWWKHNRELLERKAKVTSIPPLRDDSGKWQTGAAEKNCW